MRSRPRAAARSLGAILLCGATLVLAQAPGGSPGPGTNNGRTQAASGFGEDGNFDGPPGRKLREGPPHGPRNGLHVGPPGRWWDEKSFIQDLGLTPDQQKRMDAIFNDNRSTLAAHFQSLREEDEKMWQLAQSAAPAEDALFNEIDHLAQAHATLEKALTHYLLGIRAQLSPDQRVRLEARERSLTSHP